jgi:Zn-dependent peptidase ImmA (M78 family)
MPRSDRKASQLKQLARGLLGRADHADPGLANRLFDDLEDAIAERDDVAVEMVSPSLKSGCSIAAAYLRNSDPPRIVIGRTNSAGRKSFSLGHEFAHHLIDQDPIVADLLFEAGTRGPALEEDICDAFAAMLLIADDAVDAALGSKGVTAAAVARLFTACNASREACAVAMAQQLHGEGYVAILRQETEAGDNYLSAQFCARTQNAFPIARGTAQEDHLLNHAVRAGRAQGHARLRFPSGALTDEYHCDAVHSGGYMFAVFVSESPPWGGLSIRSSKGGGYETSWCDNCSEEFRPVGASCLGCGEYQCPTCRRCSCVAAPAPSARICRSCFLEKPGSKFVGDECFECAGID